MLSWSSSANSESLRGTSLRSNDSEEKLMTDDAFLSLPLPLIDDKFFALGFIFDKNLLHLSQSRSPKSYSQIKNFNLRLELEHKQNNSAVVFGLLPMPNFM